MVESHGREIVISNLNHKEKTKRNTRRGFSCLRVAQVTCATGGSDDVTRLAPIDWYWDNQFGVSKAWRRLLVWFYWRYDSIDKLRLHLRTQIEPQNIFVIKNHFFKQTGCINGLLPARARLYPKPYPTLPNPAPLPPRAFRFLNNPSSGQALP